MSRDLFSKATLPRQLMLPAGLAPPAAAENNTQTTPEGIGSLYSSKGNFHKRGGGGVGGSCIRMADGAPRQSGLVSVIA